MGIRGRQARRFKPLGTDSSYDCDYAPNLLGGMEATVRLDQVWVVDTTCLRARSGWPYLAMLMDLRSGG